MRKLIIFATLTLALFLPTLLFAQETKTVYISLFYSDTCPHCHKEILFLEKLEEKYPNLDVKIFEVSQSRENAQLMVDVARKLNFKHSGGVPLTVIGDQIFVGYLNEETTGARIEGIVKQHMAVGCIDIIGEIIGNGEKTDGSCQEEKKPENIALPVFGEIDIGEWSLPALTVAIAAIDGFNPCAMWVLLFLISLLLGMENKKKMWILGSSFIIASGLVYFLFLSAWLNLFLFIGFISFVRIGVGLVAIASGSFHLREWWTNKNGTCKVTNEEQKMRVMEKLKAVTEQKSFWLALLGIVSLAFAVNLIELVCSAGLPAIYTQILSLSDLSAFSYYGYLLLYILIFMLDDMAVFVIAMTTLQMTGISTKYTRWSNLIGGIVILVLGILLIFKPGWVMFA